MDEQLNTGVGPVTFAVGHVVVTQLLPLVGLDWVQLATGTLLVLLVPQVTVNHELVEPPVCDVQLCTGTLVVLFVEQVVLMY
jgi:hypothetical protein